MKIKGCEECPFLGTDIDDGSVCNLDFSIYLYSSRGGLLAQPPYPPDCPLLDGPITVELE